MCDGPKKKEKDHFLAKKGVETIDIKHNRWKTMPLFMLGQSVPYIQTKYMKDIYSCIISMEWSSHYSVGHKEINFA